MEFLVFHTFTKVRDIYNITVHYSHFHTMFAVKISPLKNSPTAIQTFPQLSKHVHVWKCHLSKVCGLVFSLGNHLLKLKFENVGKAISSSNMVYLQHTVTYNIMFPVSNGQVHTPNFSFDLYHKHSRNGSSVGFASVCSFRRHI